MSFTNIQDLPHRATPAGFGQNTLYHPGAMHADMPTYYKLFDQRRIERVPRPLLHSPPHESIPAITFSLYGWPGIRVRDILKDTVIVDFPNDTVFEQYNWKATVVRFEWPGYPDSEGVGKSIKLRPDGNHITRHELVREICCHFFNFHQRISRLTVAPGWEKWALTTGREGIRVTDVVLLSLHYYRNIWAPEFYVVE